MTPGMLLRVFLLISILGWSVEDDLLPYTTDITLEGLYEGVECKNGAHKYCGEDNAEGPHCKDCLLFLWAKTGCKNDSEKGPTHGKDSVEHWQTKTVRDVIKNMNYYKDPVMARWCHGLPETSPNVDTSTNPVTIDYLSVAVTGSAATATYRGTLQSTSGEAARDVLTRYPAGWTTGSSNGGPVDTTTGSSSGDTPERTTESSVTSTADSTTRSFTGSPTVRTSGLTTRDTTDRTTRSSTGVPAVRTSELTTGDTTDRTTRSSTGVPAVRTSGLMTGDTTDRTTRSSTGSPAGRTSGLTTGDTAVRTSWLTTGDTAGRTSGLTTGDTPDRTTRSSTGSPAIRTSWFTTGDTADRTSRSPTGSPAVMTSELTTGYAADRTSRLITITKELITDTSIEGTLDYTPAVETSEPYNRKLNIFDGKTAGASDVHITPNIPKPEKSTEVGLSSESTVPVTSNDFALKTIASSRSSHLSVTSSIIVKGSSEGPHLSVTPGGLQIGVTSAEHFAENGKTQNDQREEQSVGRGNVDDPSVHRGFPETAEQRQRAMSTKTILLVCSLVFLVLVILALGIFLYRVWVRRRASSVYNLKRGAPLESKSNGRGPPSKLQVTWVDTENEAEKNEENCSESELIPIDQLDIYSV